MAVQPTYWIELQVTLMLPETLLCVVEEKDSPLLVRIPWDATFIPRVGDDVYLDFLEHNGRMYAKKVERVEVHLSVGSPSVVVELNDDHPLWEMDVNLLYALAGLGGLCFGSPYSFREQLIRCGLPATLKEYLIKFP